ncbi:MAG: hypothetical protein Q7J05_09500 [Paludibacter sp.]|nr:hypothetical protein [Paludibacter sp.]
MEKFNNHFKLRYLPVILLSLMISAVTAQISLSDLNHIIGYGQSLSLGSVDTCVISKEQKYNSIMFSKELRTLDYSTADFSSVTFVPLVEKVWLNHTNYAESPYSGMSEMLIETIVKDNGSFDKQFFFHAPGKGGTSITGLNKGTGTTNTYDYLVRGVQRAKALASADGKSYHVPCFTWIHGEQDLSTYMNPETYKSHLTKLQEDIELDVKAISGQTETIPCVLSQTASFNRYWMLRSGGNIDKAPNPDISVALYQMALEKPEKFILATTMYPFEYGLDNVHQRAESAKLTGADFGYAIKKAVVDGENMLPIHPIDYVRNGNILTVKFHVPVKPLTFDTKQVRFIKNYGFNIYRGNTEIEIESVELISEDEVKFVCSGIVDAGDILTYAINGMTTGQLNGARGNLRDNRGEQVTFTIGCTSYQLHNWCPIFKETIK